MNRPDYSTIPIGTDGEYAVQRTHQGEVHYLESACADGKVAHLSMDFAESTAKMLRYDLLPSGHGRWIPWPTASLPTRQVRALPGAAFAFPG